MRIAAPGAVVGLVLSVLVGLLAGVGLATVLLRGVISAVVMGAGSAGLYVAAERLLPGIADGDLPGTDRGPDDDGDGPDSVPAPGGQLNIVVEDEDDSGEWDAPAEAGDGDEDEVASDAEDVSERDDADQAPEPAEVEPLEAEPLGAEASETEPLDAEAAEAEALEEQDAEPVESATPVSDGSEDEEIDDDLVEEIEEQRADDAEAVMNQAIAEEKYGSGVEIDDSVLDEMPDIGSFSGSFGSDAGAEDTDDRAGGFSAGPSGGSRRKSAGGAAGNDPAQIAKALKTMLSRDGKE